MLKAKKSMTSLMLWFIRKKVRFLNIRWFFSDMGIRRAVRGYDGPLAGLARFLVSQHLVSMMYGVRIQSDGSMQGLNEELAEYDLEVSMDKDGNGLQGVRMIGDGGRIRYLDILPMGGPYAENRFSDVCVGTIVHQGYMDGDALPWGSSDMAEEIQAAKKLIPDAETVFLQWVA